MLFCFFECLGRELIARLLMVIVMGMVTTKNIHYGIYFKKCNKICNLMKFYAWRKRTKDEIGNPSQRAVKRIVFIHNSPRFVPQNAHLI